MLLRCLLIYSAAVRDSKSGLMRWRCPSVCLSVAKMQKRDFLKNLAIYSYGVYWRLIRSRTWAFQRTQYWTLKFKMVEIRHLENRHDVNFYSEGGLIWIKFRRLVQNDMSIAVMWSKSKPHVEFQYGRRLGEFHGMSSQSHVSHCTVLPLVNSLS